MYSPSYCKGQNGLWLPRGAGPNPDGLVIWYDTPQLVGLANNDPITTCTDFSGNGNHATQATASKQPRYMAGVQNGLPVMRLDGVDDYFDSVTMGGSVSYFIVAKGPTDALGYWPNQYTSFFEQKTWVDNASNWGLFTIGPGAKFHSTGLPVAVWKDGVSLASPFSLSPISDSFHVYSLTTKNATSALRAIGNSDGSVLSADIAELVLYNRIHSDTERQYEENRLATKWGL